MKKLKFIIVTIGLLVVVFCGTKAVRVISVVSKPTELKTTHFVISYHGIYKEEAQAIAQGLEDSYDRIRMELNDPSHDLINVFVYPTQTDFNKGTGLLNGKANGTSRGSKEFHLLWTNWFNSIFPNDPVQTAIHEFTHCVQLNILIAKEQMELASDSEAQFNELFEKKFSDEYPQWFWEALCDYEAGIVNTMSVKYGMKKQLSLKDLNNSNQIYNVGYTLIEYIVEKWGKEKLPILITSYGDIQSVLGISESDFEKGWRNFVEEKY